MTCYGQSITFHLCCSFLLMSPLQGLQFLQGISSCLDMGSSMGCRGISPIAHGASLLSLIFLRLVFPGMFLTYFFPLTPLCCAEAWTCGLDGAVPASHHRSYPCLRTERIKSVDVILCFIYVISMFYMNKLDILFCPLKGQLNRIEKKPMELSSLWLLQ